MGVTVGMQFTISLICDETSGKIWLCNRERERKKKKAKGEEEEKRGFGAWTLPKKKG